MKKEEIITLINDSINNKGFTNGEKLNETYEISTYSFSTNFKLELSNSSSSKPNTFSYKIDKIEDIAEIWVQITNVNIVDLNLFTENALTKFNIDKKQDIYLILVF